MLKTWYDTAYHAVSLMRSQTVLYGNDAWCLFPNLVVCLEPLQVIWEDISCYGRNHYCIITVQVTYGANKVALYRAIKCASLHPRR